MTKQWMYWKVPPSVGQEIIDEVQERLRGLGTLLEQGATMAARHRQRVAIGSLVQAAMIAGLYTGNTVVSFLEAVDSADANWTEVPVAADWLLECGGSLSVEYRQGQLDAEWLRTRLALEDSNGALGAPVWTSSSTT